MDFCSCYWVSGLYKWYFNFEDYEFVWIFIRGIILGNFNYIYYSGRNFCFSDYVSLVEFIVEFISLIKWNGMWYI